MAELIAVVSKECLCGKTVQAELKFDWTCGQCPCGRLMVFYRDSPYKILEYPQWDILSSGQGGRHVHRLWTSHGRFCGLEFQRQWT